MRDPELVARAQRAATRLESAWEQWRALHGLAVAPGQPVVSYVGYSLKEPWGEPRVVIGIDADEAEYLAEFLDRDECVQRVQIPQQQGLPQYEALPSPGLTQQGLPQQGIPQQGIPQQGVPQQGVPQQGLPQQGLPQRRPEPPAEGTGEHARAALLGASVSYGRHAPDPVRDMATELAGWQPGELPGQVTDQFATWPAVPQTGIDQPPASA
jgi:hypothetical protein